MVSYGVRRSAPTRQVLPHRTHPRRGTMIPGVCACPCVEQLNVSVQFVWSATARNGSGYTEWKMLYAWKRNSAASSYGARAHVRSNS